jgi:hypothetical protein
MLHWSVSIPVETQVRVDGGGVSNGLGFGQDSLPEVRDP